jgi:prevent-host-death family protein
MKPFQLQKAKQQFCAVAERAAAGEPQLVTKHGRPHVWIVGDSEWQHTRRRKQSLVDALRACPVDLTKLHLTRDREHPRDISL